MSTSGCSRRKVKIHIPHRVVRKVLIWGNEDTTRRDESATNTVKRDSIKQRRMFVVVTGSSSRVIGSSSSRFDKRVKNESCQHELIMYLILAVRRDPHGS